MPPTVDLEEQDIVEDLVVDVDIEHETLDAVEYFDLHAELEIAVQQFVLLGNFVAAVAPIVFALLRYNFVVQVLH